MAQRINLEVHDYRNERKKLSVTVRFAQTNHYPALGIDVWIAPRLKLFGGLVDIASPDHLRTVEMSNIIRTNLGVPLWAS